MDHAAERHPPRHGDRRPGARATSTSTPRTLGLRLVKKTVNFDDPGTYHLYYGDETGSARHDPDLLPLGACRTGPARRRPDPGDPVPGARRARSATGRTGLIEQGVPHEAPVKRFGETVLAVQGPDGMQLGARRRPRRRGRARLERRRRPGRARDPRLPRRQPAARGCGTDRRDPDRRVRLRRGRPRRLASSASRRRTRRIGGIVDIRGGRRLPAGRMGGGSVHHIAFRAADDAAQAEMVEQAGPGPPHPRPPSRRTATTSARSTSASPAASCSRSRPTIRASPPTSRSPRSGRR